MKLASLAALSVLALAGSAAHGATPSANAWALLGDGRIVKLNLGSRRIVAQRSLGRTPRGVTTHGKMLALDGDRIYALVPTRPKTLVVVDRAFHVLARTRLPDDVSYRGLVRASGQTYLFGYMPGQVVDPVDHLRESAAILSRVDDGRIQSWTIRPAERHDWWEWRGEVSANGRWLALSYHGGCGGGFAELCTSGTDLIDLNQTAPQPSCAQPTAPNLGCIADVHGSVEPFGEGWIAATGDERLLLLDAAGTTLRELHSGFENEHLMEFAIDPARSTVFALATCFYAREGLRAISIDVGTSRLVRRGVCGSDVTLGPRSTLLAVPSSDARAGNEIVAISRSSGGIVRRWRFSPAVVAITDG
jgi:hypothetical protein